jgi:PAS domain S-box-containing protein
VESRDCEHAAERFAVTSHALGETRARVLVERLPLVTYSLLLEPPYRAVYISPQLRPIFGYDPGAPIHDDDFWMSKIAIEDLPVFRVALERLEVTHEPMSVEYRLTTADGRLVWVRDVAVVAREDDGQLYVHGYLADVTREKNLERELDAERALADAFFGASSAGLGITDPAGRYVRVNDALARINGATVDEHLGRTLAEIAPEVAAAALPLIHEVVETGAPIRERELRWTRGRDAHVTIGSVFPIELGDELRYGRIVLDVTEQRRAEAEYRTLLEQLPLVTYVNQIFPENKTTYVSPQVVELFGYPVEQWLDDPSLWERVVHPDDLPIVTRAEAEARERHERFELEYRFVRADGSAGWVLDRMDTIYDTDGTALLERGFLVDVTAARESENMFRAVFDSAFEAFLLIDDELRFVDANAAACRLYGVLRDDLVGRSLTDFAEDGLPVDALWGDFSATGAATGARTIVRADGVPRDVEYSARANVLPGRHLVVLRDVTERRSLERELWRAQKLESVGRLAGGVAHDFNNMLTAIRGFAQLLRAHAAEGSLESHHAGEIDRAAERAATLTAQLLALGRRQMLQPRVVDLNHVVEELGTMIGRIVGDGVEVSYELEAGLVPTRVDPAQVHQLLMNLVTNAADAMDGSGSILIRTANADVGPPPYDGRPDVPTGRYAVVSVEDTGPGIDGIAAEHLFEPFFTTKDAIGSGLGLAASYGIAKQSGGTIVVATERGRGAEFSVYLPEALAAAPEPAAGGGGETVLVLEADPAVSEVAFEVLSDAGYRVLTARSAADAAAIVARAGGAVDLLVYDGDGPVAAGRAAALRDAHPGLRTLALEKPYGTEPLRAHVRAALDE